VDIWIKRAVKKARCLYCPEPITKGQYMVIGKLWRRRDGTPRVWTVYLRWHPQCWIDQAIRKLEKLPVMENRGRKSLGLSDETREARVKIMMRRAAVVQRIRNEIGKPKEEQSIDKIIHLGELLNKLKEEIEPLGGVPKSWN